MDDGKRVLDPCCGSKMFWFDKDNSDVEFCDFRTVEDEVIYRSKDGKNERRLTVSPDTVCSVTNLPFADNSFYHVVFDPPHIAKIGDNAWMARKYGKLQTDWKTFIRDGFCECMRVLKPNGTLIFKWSEIDIKVSEVLAQIPFKPLYGHRSGKHMATHWIAFLKDDAPTVDAEPVRHGHWIIHNALVGNMLIDENERYVCSECGRAEKQKEPYCNCGAKMDGGEDEDA